MFDNVVQSILYVAAVFAILPGVALLSSALTNTLKAVGGLFGFNFDGKSDKVTAWINLVVFIALIYFRVFQPDLSFDFLDARAQDIANALFALAFFAGQLGLQPVVHSFLRDRLPLVGYTYSK